ncbi:MAG: 2'-5' RNA ligase family protein [Candidatus Omnitrophota bacterium]|nr:2'-5' RNA ligase family protein [Candidatus Omnitrophota bacterium]
MRRHTRAGRVYLVNKAISLCVAICLAVTQTEAYALSVVDPAPSVSSRPFSFSIPDNLGNVDESHQGTSGKTIIFVQDAHDSLEAQESIAGMIDHLVGSYGINTVFEEGYEGSVPSDRFFNDIQDPAVRERVSYYLMDQLRIGGAEYSYINRKRDFRLIGADSLKLHRENLEWYQRAAMQRELTDRDLASLHDHILKLANRYFPRPLKEWMRFKKSYDQGKLLLIDYLKRSQAFVDTAAYSNISLLLEAEHSEDAALHERAKAMDGKTFFAEIEAMERDLARCYLATTRDRNIFNYYRVLSLLKRLSAIEVSAEEYQAVASRLAHLKTRKLARFIVGETGETIALSKEWEKNIRNAVNFYELAGRRDDAIEKSLAKYLRQDEEKAAVLVFGGFHKGRIIEILHRRGFSYHVVVPKITGVSSRHQEQYRKLMSRGYDRFEIPARVAKAARPASDISVVTVDPRQEPAFRAELRVLGSIVKSLQRRGQKAAPSEITLQLKSRSELRSPDRDSRFKGVNEGYSAVVMQVSEPVRSRILQFGKKIPGEDLFFQEYETDLARVKEPHITLQYRIETNDPSELARVVKSFGPIRVRLGKTGIFERPDAGYDVVFLQAEGERLHDLHNLIANDLDHDSPFLEFAPHITLAYVKKGLGVKYDSISELEGMTFEIDTVSFVQGNGDQTEIRLAEESPEPFARPAEEKASAAITKARGMQRAVGSVQMLDFAIADEKITTMPIPLQPRFGTRAWFESAAGLVRELAIGLFVITVFTALNFFVYLPWSAPLVAASPLMFFPTAMLFAVVTTYLGGFLAKRFKTYFSLSKYFQPDQTLRERIWNNIRETVIPEKKFVRIILQTFLFGLPVYGFFLFGWYIPHIIPGAGLLPALGRAAFVQLLLAPFFIDPVNYVVGRIFFEKKSFAESVRQARKNLPTFTLSAIVVWLGPTIFALYNPNAITTFVWLGIAQLIWTVISLLLLEKEKLNLNTKVKHFLKRRFGIVTDKNSDGVIGRVAWLFDSFYNLPWFGLYILILVYTFYFSTFIHLATVIYLTLQNPIIISDGVVIGMLLGGIAFYPFIYPVYRRLIRYEERIMDRTPLKGIFQRGGPPASIGEFNRMSNELHEQARIRAEFFDVFDGAEARSRLTDAEKGDHLRLSETQWKQENRGFSYLESTWLFNKYREISAFESAVRFYEESPNQVFRNSDSVRAGYVLALHQMGLSQIFNSRTSLSGRPYLDRASSAARTAINERIEDAMAVPLVDGYTVSDLVKELGRPYDAWRQPQVRLLVDAFNRRFNGEDLFAEPEFRFKDGRLKTGALLKRVEEKADFVEEAISTINKRIVESVYPDLYLGLAAAHKNKYILTSLLTTELKKPKRDRKVEMLDRWFLLYDTYFPEGLLKQQQFRMEKNNLSPLRVVAEYERNAQFASALIDEVEANGHRALYLAYEIYMEVFKQDLLNYHAGMNVVRALISFGGPADLIQAKELALIVRTSAEHGGPKSFWRNATLLEMALVQKDTRRVTQSFSRLLEVVQNDSAYESFRRHLERWRDLTVSRGESHDELDWVIKHLSSVAASRYKSEPVETLSTAASEDGRAQAMVQLMRSRERAREDSVTETIDRRVIRLDQYRTANLLPNNIAQGGFIVDILGSTADSDLIQGIVEYDVPGGVSLKDIKDPEEADQWINHFVDRVFGLVQWDDARQAYVRVYEDLDQVQHRELDAVMTGFRETVAARVSERGTTNALAAAAMGFGDARYVNFTKQRLSAAKARYDLKRDLRKALDELLVNKNADAFREALVEAESNNGREFAIAEMVIKAPIAMGTAGTGKRLMVEGSEGRHPLLVRELNEIEEEPIAIEIERDKSGVIQAVILRNGWYRDLYRFGYQRIEGEDLENLRSGEGLRVRDAVSAYDGDGKLVPSDVYLNFAPYAADRHQRTLSYTADGFYVGGHLVDKPSVEYFFDDDARAAFNSTMRRYLQTVGERHQSSGVTERSELRVQDEIQVVRSELRDGKGINVLPELIAVSWLLVMGNPVQSAAVLLPAFIFAAAISRLALFAAIGIHGLGHSLSSVLTDGKWTSEKVNYGDVLRGLLPFQEIPAPSRSVRETTPQADAGIEGPVRTRVKAASGIFFNAIAVYLLIAFGLPASAIAFSGFSLLGADLALYALAALASWNVVYAITSLADVRSILSGKATVFCCGVVGAIGYDETDLIKKIQAMMFFTLLRGQQAFGISQLFLYSERAFRRLAVEGEGIRDSVRVLDAYQPEESDRIGPKGIKVLNTKRGNLIRRFVRRWLFWGKIWEFANFKPLKGWFSFIAHSRYATVGPTSKLETHPHSWMDPRRVVQWRAQGDKLVVSERILSNRIVHNGDFNEFKTLFYKFMGKERTIPELKAWLERVLNTPNATTGDSPKIAGLMDFLITQGMWYSSVRFAYHTVIPESFNDVMDGEIPSEDDLTFWAAVFEDAFIETRDELLRADARSLADYDSDAVEALIRTVTERINRDPAVSFRFLGLPYEKRERFARASIYAFLENDSYRAAQTLLTNASDNSTFGLAIQSTTDVDKKRTVLVTKAQPMMISRDKSNGNIYHASEADAAKAKELIDRDNLELFRMDQTGEAVAIGLEQKNAYSLATRAEVPLAVVERRWVSAEDNPYVSTPPPAEAVKRGDVDPMTRDVLGIPAERKRVRDAWEGTSLDRNNLNLEAADNFAEDMIKKIAEQQALTETTGKAYRAATPDLLVVGLEKSEWVGENFVNNFSKIAPLPMRTISSNTFLREIVKTHQTLVGENTTVLFISESGQSFPTYQALVKAEELRRKGAIAETFILTHQFDTEMADAIGQAFHRSAPFTGRIFTTGSWPSHAEAASRAVVALDQTLTQLWLHIASRMVENDIPISGALQQSRQLLRDLKKDNGDLIAGSQAVVESEDLKSGALKTAWEIKATAWTTIFMKAAIFSTVLVGFPAVTASILGILGYSFVQALAITEGIALSAVLLRLFDTFLYTFGGGIIIVGLRVLGKWRGKSKGQIASRVGMWTLAIISARNHRFLGRFLREGFSLSPGLFTINPEAEDPETALHVLQPHRGWLILYDLPNGELSEGMALEQRAVLKLAPSFEGNRSLGATPQSTLLTTDEKLAAKSGRPTIVPHRSELRQEDGADLRADLIEGLFDSAIRLDAGYSFLSTVIGETATLKIPLWGNLRLWSWWRKRGGKRTDQAAQPVGRGEIDPVTQDVLRIPSERGRILNAWTIDSAVNTKNLAHADRFAEAMKTKAREYRELEETTGRRFVLETPDLLIIGHDQGLWAGEQFGDNLERIAPIHIRTVSENVFRQETSKANQKLVGKNTTILFIDESELTESTDDVAMGAGNFILTHRFDGETLGGARVLTTNAQPSRADIPSRTVVALQQTLTQLWLHTANAMAADGSATMGSPESSAELLELLYHKNSETVAASAAAINSVELREDASRWAWEVRTRATVAIFMKALVAVTVFAGFPVFAGLASHGFGVPFLTTLAVAEGVALLVYLFRLLDTLFYSFGGGVIVLILRVIAKLSGHSTGQIMSRMGARTIAISDPVNHRLLGNFLHKGVSRAHAVFGINRENADPDEAQHGWHPTTAWHVLLGAPDGRRSEALELEEGVITELADAFSQNAYFGARPQITTLTTNPNLAESTTGTVIVTRDAAPASDAETDLSADLKEGLFDSSRRLDAGFSYLSTLMRSVATVKLPVLGEVRLWAWWGTQAGTKTVTTPSPFEGPILEATRTPKLEEIPAEKEVAPLTLQAGGGTVTSARFQIRETPVSYYGIAWKFFTRDVFGHLTFLVLASIFSLSLLMHPWAIIQYAIFFVSILILDLWSYWHTTWKKNPNLGGAITFIISSIFFQGLMYVIDPNHILVTFIPGLYLHRYILIPFVVPLLLAYVGRFLLRQRADTPGRVKKYVTQEIPRGRFITRRFIGDEYPKAHPALFPDGTVSPAFERNTTAAYNLLMAAGHRHEGIQFIFERILQGIEEAQGLEGLQKLDLSFDLDKIFLIYADTQTLSGEAVVKKYLLGFNPSLAALQKDETAMDEILAKYENLTNEFTGILDSSAILQQLHRLASQNLDALTSKEDILALLANFLGGLRPSNVMLLERRLQHLEEVLKIVDEEQRHGRSELRSTTRREFLKQLAATPIALQMAGWEPAARTVQPMNWLVKHLGSKLAPELTRAWKRSQDRVNVPTLLTKVLSVSFRVLREQSGVWAEIVQDSGEWPAIDAAIRTAHADARKKIEGGHSDWSSFVNDYEQTDGFRGVKHWLEFKQRPQDVQAWVEDVFVDHEISSAISGRLTRWIRRFGPDAYRIFKDLSNLPSRDLRELHDAVSERKAIPRYEDIQKAIPKLRQLRENQKSLWDDIHWLESHAVWLRGHGEVNNIDVAFPPEWLKEMQEKRQAAERVNQEIEEIKRNAFKERSELRSTLPPFRDADVSHALQTLDVSARGTLTMPVATVAALVRSELRGGTEAEAARQILDELYLVAYRWKKVRIYFYGNTGNNHSRTEYYLSQLSRLSNVAVTEAGVVETLSLRGEDDHVSVDISEAGIRPTSGLMPSRLKEHLKFVKLRQRPGLILMSLWVTLTQGSAIGRGVHEADGFLEPQTALEQQFQAYLNEQVVEWSA